ncbi:MAG: hypothetical protein IT162_11850 [Bryobacterales bacterium]|nr:hypothetical protein [Bryobacterales bacterium]
MSWMDRELMEQLGLKPVSEIEGELAMLQFWIQFGKAKAIADDAKRQADKRKKEEAARRALIREALSDSLLSQYTFCVTLATYIGRAGNTPGDVAGTLAEAITGATGGDAAKIRTQRIQAYLGKRNKEYARQADQIKTVIGRFNDTKINASVHANMLQFLKACRVLFAPPFSNLASSQPLAWLAAGQDPDHDGLLEARYEAVRLLSPCLVAAASMDEPFRLSDAREKVKTAVIESMVNATGLPKAMGVKNEYLAAVRKAVQASHTVVKI